MSWWDDFLDVIWGAVDKAINAINNAISLLNQLASNAATQLSSALLNFRALFLVGLIQYLFLSVTA